MATKQKLELTWIGKEKRARLEPRILIEVPEKSHHAATRRKDGKDSFDNMLIHGDNLLALKALEQKYTGQVKCIYIDPPYNTGNAFEHYDDGLEHSIWLGLMRDRIELLHKLLRKDGFFCCQIDDSEGPYLKVVLDEVFGRDNYLTTFFVQVRYPDKTLKQDMAFHKEIEQIHIYRKDYGARPNQKEADISFDKFCWYVKELAPGTEMTLGHKKVVLFKPGEYSIEEGEPSVNGLKEIWASGTILDGNSSGRFFRDYLTGRAQADGLGVLYKVYGIGDDQLPYRYFTGPKRASATKGKYYQGVPSDRVANPNQKKYLPIENFYDFSPQFGNCRSEGDADFRGGKKPEKLLEMILNYFSAPGDLVLDSFLGSGTTAAVAHKMGRRWIGIELGDHCYTHCQPRLTKVVDGEQGGISEAVKWKGGGGFQFFELAETLVTYDQWGQPVINKNFNAEMLSRAVCKLEGFEYAPSKDEYFIHGHSSERSFIYVTTSYMRSENLRALSEQIGAKRTLLICCRGFETEAKFRNLTVKKIPKAVLDKCEWGHDDYSLNVRNLPISDEPAEIEQGELF